MHLVYKNQSLITEIPGNDPLVKINGPIKEKSFYTIAREQRFRKAALKKYADEIKEIRKYFPDWDPCI